MMGAVVPEPTQKRTLNDVGIHLRYYYSVSVVHCLCPIYAFSGEWGNRNAAENRTVSVLNDKD